MAKDFDEDAFKRYLQELEQLQKENSILLKNTLSPYREEVELINGIPYFRFILRHYL